MIQIYLAEIDAAYATGFLCAMPSEVVAVLRADREMARVLAV